MSFAGGFFGAIVGGIVGGPIGAVVGAFLGSAVTHTEERKPIPLEDFFRCLGKLAKADGLVSEDEAAFVRELMAKMNLNTEVVRHTLNRAFREGRDSSASFRELVQIYVRHLEEAGYFQEMAEVSMQVFCGLTLIDGTVSPEELTMLREAEACFGLHIVDEFFRSTAGGSSSKSHFTTPDQLEKAYQLLEVSPSATDAEVKKAWHRKVKTYHPDHAQGAGLSAGVIEAAKEKMQEINEAYELICKSRAKN